jgi:hypothetical protein
MYISNGTSLIQAVIFDMDGLMLDTERIDLQSFRKVATELTIPTAEDLYFRTIAGIGRIQEKCSLRCLAMSFHLTTYASDGGSTRNGIWTNLASRAKLNKGPLERG